MQHKDIPDGQRHELKGASTALAGSVPVANGSGSTSFQKLGSTSLSGSIPSTIPDLLIGTDGAGGFKAMDTASYGSWTLSGAVSDLPNPSQPESPLARFSASTPTITPKGVNCVGGILTVNVSGAYLVGAGSYTFIPPTETIPGQFVTDFHAIYNLNTGELIAYASPVHQGINLQVSIPYVILGTGAATLTVEKVGV